MIELMKRSLVLIAQVAAVLVLARTWLTRPDLFPPFPQSLAERLAQWFGTRSAEDVLNVEIMLSLLLSTAIVCLFSLLARRWWRARRAA